MGTIEMAYLSAGATEGFYPKSGLMGTLFTARDEDHALKIWKSEKGTEVVEFTVSDTLTYVDESGISEAPTNNMGGPGGGGGRGQGGTPPSGNFEGGRGQAPEGNQNNGQTNESSSQ